jgi:hypothetical protein
VSENPFNAVPLLERLREHGVEFVVIGGIAGIAHGSPMLTRDLDICYARTPENYEALAAALRSVHATLRGAPADLPFKLDARTIQMGDHFTFSTDVGPLDCLGTPSGSGGYSQLLENAVEVRLRGVPFKVCGLDDLIRMKRAAGRPKDLVALENLGALRAELDGEPDPP